MAKLKRTLQEENAKLIKHLVDIVSGEVCSFAFGRKFKGGSCKEENGRGFSCYICAAEEYLNSLGIKIDRR